MLSLAWQECKRDPKYIVCFLGVGAYKMIAVLAGNYFILWFTSFVDEGLITEKESAELYQKVVIISSLVSFLTAPLCGMAGDRVPSKILVPCSYLLRAASGFLWTFAQVPESFFVYFVAILMGIGTGLEFISISVLFYRGLPGKIRGTMQAAMTFFGTAGKLIFTLSGGHMFDHLGRNSPFIFQATADMVVVVAALILIWMGKLN